LNDPDDLNLVKYYWRLRTYPKTEGNRG